MDPNECVLGLKSAFAEDPHFAWVWHCNVAMAALDRGVNIIVANEIAADFMKTAFDVDTRKCDEWKSVREGLACNEAT